jgi:hypothetical protein
MLTITVVLSLTRGSRAGNNLGLYIRSIQVAAMKIVASDKTYVDYFQRVCASRRGLTSCFGIRVKERRCFIVFTIGEGSPEPMWERLSVASGA